MEVHYTAMIAIGFGSLVFGLLPMGLSFRATRSYALMLSLLLCLGAGILLATSLIHMLTEVQTKLKLSAQLYFCAGFLILYSFDEISHYCLSFKRSQIHSSVTLDERSHVARFREGSNYGTVAETEHNCEPNNQVRKFQESSSGSQHHACGDSQVHHRCSEDNYEVNFRQNLLGVSSDLSNFQDETCRHVDIGESRASNFAAKTGLIIALLIHSLLEGVSIGVQTQVSQILLILGAVGFHKVILSFCLGLELRSNGYKNLSFITAIFLFSVGSPIGILIGMSVTSKDGIFSIDAQLQAIAAGSLLYVAALEVLPRERFKWQHNNSQKAAGIFQLIFLLLGFLCITAFHLFLGAEHDDFHTRGDEFKEVTLQSGY